MIEDAPPDAPDLPPLRTCPNCGREGRTRYERCPFCQTSYYARNRNQKRRRLAVVVGALAVLIVLGGVGTVFALSDRDDRNARQKTQQGKLVAALRVKLTRIQAPHRGAAPELRPPAGASDGQRLAARKALVGAVERRITADARARAAAGELDGPITHTECGPILKARNAIPDDRVLAKDVGRYDCVAIKHAVIAQEGEKVADLGHAFVAALNFKTYTYTWCRNTPAQGEAGVALVFVRLDRSCLAAKGKALGSGYAAMPGEQNETSDDVSETAG
ncbi:hypothetical protein DSM104299_02899 [Baekduia alba]|uniref:hypothetical protein n=1 Tax=Baekduia alba TaxID=2997333 RepID=UPI00233FB927|nr:hypothetical protein [Baekduia alba]WCB94170.1 hypothetical protein DSM104299_02899 [Baekduia alba]